MLTDGSSPRGGRLRKSTERDAAHGRRSAERVGVDLDPDGGQLARRAHALHLHERRGTAPRPTGAAPGRPSGPAVGASSAAGAPAAARRAARAPGRAARCPAAAAARPRAESTASGGAGEHRDAGGGRQVAPCAAPRPRARRSPPGPSAPAPAAPGCAGSPTATTRPPWSAGRASAAALNQRRTASSAVRRSGRASISQVSSSTTAA